MAISYGTITITDKTDLGQLSIYLTGSTVNQQACDINHAGDGNDPYVYYPDWATTALVITPHAVYNGTALTINDFTVSWKKQENGAAQITVPKQSPDTTDPETLALDGKSLVRQKNLVPNSLGVIYEATISYAPIAGDPSTVISATTTISFYVNSYGLNGTSGAPGKSLQLIGSGSYFTYTWNNDSYGNSTITLNAQKSNITNVCWKCNGYPIYSGSTPSMSGSIPYTSDQLIISGDSSVQQGSNTVYIENLASSTWENGYAEFQICEANSDGTAVTNGFTDYFTIYKYTEARPGDSLYSSYLSNNGETIVTYQNITDLSGAVTQLYINQGGSNDITNWHTQVAASVTDTSKFNYVQWNTLDYLNGTFIGHSTTTISNNGTQNPTINGTVIQTSSLTANSLVSYYNSSRYDVFCWNGSKWVLTRTNLLKYGPDSVAIITFDVSAINLAKITFTSQRGTYDGSNFTPNTNIATLHNVFTVNKSASVISHSLRISAINANKTTSGVYNPPEITIGAVERSESGPEDYVASSVLATIVHYKNNPSVTSTNLSVPRTITLANLANASDLSYIEVFLGNGSTSTGIEDKQTISFSSDGANGTSPWLFTTDNPYDNISTDFSYKVTTTKTYSIKLNATQGEIASTLYHQTGTVTNYPNVVHSCSVSGASSHVSYRYNGSNMTSSGTNAYKVDEILFTVTANDTNIFDQTDHSGVITITFYSDASTSVSRTYTYKAMPEAIQPTVAQIYTEPPGAVFTNQTGESIAFVQFTSGTADMSSSITSYTWQVYTVGTGWQTLINSGTPASDEILMSGVATGLWNNNTWTPKPNGGTGINLSPNLKVTGSVVEGCLGFRVIINATIGGVSGTYSAIVNFIDYNDPLQVTLHSTIGKELVNGVGIGVIYARVMLGETEIDELPPDDKIGVGTNAPTSSSSYPGMLGYCVRVNNDLIDYYERSSTGVAWTKRNNPTAKYSWYFRDKNNEPITYTSSGTPTNLNILSQDNASGRVNTTQQFVYLSRDIVNKKLTADVKVEKS